MSEETKHCPFCAEVIYVTALKCRYCLEFMPGYSRESIVRDYVGGDRIEVGDVSNAEGVAIGHSARAAKTGDVGGDVILGDVTFEKDEREEQYRLALNWDGKTSLRGFDLAERDLSDVKLPNADLCGANLCKTNLSKADLSGADLFEANLSEANLFVANLSSASLRCATLRETDLRGAILWKTDLRQTDLAGANLDRARLLESEYDQKTTWPDGFDPEEAEAILAA